MALSATRPLAVDLFDSIFTTSGDGGLRLTEIQVPEGSALAGTTIEQACNRGGVHALALKRGDGELIVGPGADVVLETGDGLILVGSSSELEPWEGKSEG